MSKQEGTSGAEEENIEDISDKAFFSFLDSNVFKFFNSNLILLLLSSILFPLILTCIDSCKRDRDLFHSHQQRVTAIDFEIESRFLQIEVRLDRLRDSIILANENPISYSSRVKDILFSFKLSPDSAPDAFTVVNEDFERRSLPSLIWELKSLLIEIGSNDEATAIDNLAKRMLANDYIPVIDSISINEFDLILNRLRSDLLLERWGG